MSRQTGDRSDQERRGFLRQEARLAIGTLYGLGLLILGQFVNGQLPPPFTTEGLWFYTGFLPLVLARFIIEPYFTRPADALTNGLALLVASVTLAPAAIVIPQEALDAGRAAIGIYASVTLIVAIIAMLGRDQASPFFRAGPPATSIAALFGGAEVGFSLYLGFVAVIAFGDEPQALALLGASWVILLFLRPLEWIATRLQVRRSLATPRVGVLADGLLDPNLVTASAAHGVEPSVGDRVHWESGSEGTIVDRTFILNRPRLVVSLDQAGPVSTRERGELIVASGPRSVLGHVADGTTLDELVVRASPIAEPSVEEGRLLSARIRSRAAFFQITRGVLVERGDAGARRQLSEIRARKLGTWNATNRGFDQIPWMADAGTAVELIEPARAPDTIGGVGRVPGTSYEIGVKVPDLVTHNTAILGILGVGKTSLAWELIQRMIAEGIRVIVFDITGEYGTRFGRWFDESQAVWMYGSIEGAIGPRRDNTRPPKESAGNVGDVKPAFAAVLERFTANPASVLIVNPGAIEITQEDGFPAGNVVPLRRLTVPEVTRLLSEAILEHAKDKWPADPERPSAARLCVVLEEAHSLVPEGGSTSDKNESTAAAKAARAVLQGRKYGVGCLLITQRTANVTKTILNQCHTVFAMRSFDATSEQFLGNYLGADYASLLPSLREKQAILFGRGSTSQSPILIELNDRTDFAAQWANELAGVPVTQLGPSTPTAAPSTVAPLLGDAGTAAPPADRQTDGPYDELDDLPF